MNINIITKTKIMKYIYIIFNLILIGNISLYSQCHPPIYVYIDADGDGFYSTDPVCRWDLDPSVVYITTQGDDCNDFDEFLNPNSMWYLDADNDGFGTPTVSVQQCFPPIGYVLYIVGDLVDCEDSNSAINPYSIWYLDSDGDGYGSSVQYQTLQCQKPIGYVINNTDCNDNNAAYNVIRNWGLDTDGDGFGEPSTAIFACSPPNSNYISNIDDECPNSYGLIQGCIVPNASTTNFENTTNYIINIKPKIGVTSTNQLTQNKDVTVNTTYYDGLGRPMQQIAQGQSATGKDIVTPIEYDAYGRMAKEYLPYASAQNSMAFIDNATVTGALPAQYTSMYGDGVAYAEKQFEASPLNRVLKQAAPGSAWALGSGHEIKFDYQTNSDNEVKRYKATTNWNANTLLYDIALVDDGSYSPNELYKTITKDENWTSGTNNTVEEFKDKEGRVVLKRTYNNYETHDTYYVYDIYGNLTYVLPPLVTNPLTQLDGLCYQYKYDYRNRLVEKKLPGKQWEYIVYDKLDRVVATGPALAPFTNMQTTTPVYGWLVTKYDAFNRPVLTGWVQTTFTTTTRKDLQAQHNNATVLSEIKAASTTTINGIAFNYTNQCIPTTNYHVLTLNYYDDYTTNITFTPAISYTAAVTPAPACYNNTVGNTPKGLPTISWTRILEGSTNYNAEKSYTIYDLKGRVVKTFTQNYLGGYIQTESQLESITGRVNYTLTSHKRLAADTAINLREDFTYTDQDRLLKHTHQINALPPQLLSLNTYDELGKLIAKRIGDTDVSPTAIGLQKVDYSYNIRGWLTAINNVNNLQQGTDPQDLFAFKINYNTVENALHSTLFPLYNGNIAETFWRTSSDNILRKYGYRYDNLNRLKNAIYQKPNASVPVPNSYNESVSYDKNGNIIQLSRTGEMDDDVNQIEIDALSYFYAPNSNQLDKVDDSSGSSAGFKNGTNTGNDYTYDANGNMITDANKNILSIKYNHLNLPTEIIFGGSTTTRKINYLYTATGQKVKKTVTNGTNIAFTEYFNGFQYSQSGLAVARLQFFPTAEGYVSNTVVNGANTYKYVFNYQDHLGNNRLSFTKNTATNPVVKILEENHYYPFGVKHNNYNLDQEYFDACAANPLEVCINMVNSMPYKYRYQGQERQDELGLNWDSFKWRNYDYTIGRFMNVDKLAEDYSYQSPYNFAENRVIDGRELEGLEWRSSTSSDGKTVSLNLNYRVVNNTSGNLTNAQVATLANERANALSCTFGGVDSQGRTVNVTATQSKDATMVWEYNTALHGDIVDWPKGTTEQQKETTLGFAKGITSKIGDTQSNTTQVNVGTPEVMKYDDKGMPMFNDKASRTNAAQTGMHEDGHTLGLRHENDSKNKNWKEQSKDAINLMNDGGPGTNISPNQRSEFIKNIELQQPK